MQAPIHFSFTEEERRQAKEEAIRRQSVNEARGLRGRNKGASVGDKALLIHSLGAAGEMAVASYLGLKQYLYQEIEAKRGSADLPGNIDVKTRSRHSYDLIVQKNENPDKRFVLVTIQEGTTLIHGWCYGRDAMQPSFWADPARGRPAYFMPKEHLSPISELS